MIVDDAEGIIRFLDNVSVQLADLLDIQGQRTTKRSRVKDAAKQNSRSRPTIKQSKNPSTAISRQRKRHQLMSKGNQANRVRGRRKQQHTNNDGKMETTNHQVDASPITQAAALSNCVQPTNTGSPQILEHNISTRLDQHSHYTDSSVKSQSGNNESQIDSQLTLNLTDELAGSSISPITQLSPIDQSIQQFSSPVIHHQQHYYNNRTHLDSYPTIQDEFSIGAHESNPITDPSTHLLGSTISDQVQRINYHEMGTIQDQQQTPLQEPSNSDCYPLHNHITQPLSHHHHHHNHHHHHHNTHHHHQHQHRHQEPHQHHVVQFSHLDQPGWLCSTSHNTSDVNLQSTGQPSDSDTLEHVVPFSPNAQHTLEQVQFSGSMYHPTTSYYTHSTANDHQLESFRHIADDFGGNRPTSSQLSTSMTPTNDSSSPLNQLHRLVAHDQQSHPSQGLDNEQQSHSVRSTLDASVANDTTNMTGYHTSHSHHDNYLQSQSHLNETTSHNLTGLDHLQQNRNYSSQQSVHLNTPTTTTTTSQNTQHHHAQHHHHQHHHQHHHNQHLNQSHHVLPLINGLEPSGVIIQDINLAAASWSSPEDLYGI